MGYHHDDIGDETAQEKRVLEYGKILEKISIIVTERMMKPWLHPDIIFHTYHRIKGTHTFFEKAYSLPLQILKKKREEMKQDYPDLDNDSSNTEGKKQKTFIEILLNSELFKDMDDQELANEVVTFILTGSETTAITVCFTLLMLAMNPSFQEQVYEELQNVFGDSDRPANLADLRQLILMERCINETLRRFPPAPFIGRQLQEDIELSDGRILPAGVIALLAIFLMHMSEKIYENPNEWNPDRFLPEEVEKHHPNSFAPFSLGPRACIGAKYAMLGVKAQLSSILRAYKFTTDMKMSDIVLGFDIVLRNQSGFKVHAQRRRVPNKELLPQR